MHQDSCLEVTGIKDPLYISGLLFREYSTCLHPNDWSPSSELIEPEASIRIEPQPTICRPVCLGPPL